MRKKTQLLIAIILAFASLVLLLASIVVAVLLRSPISFFLVFGGMFFAVQSHEMIRWHNPQEKLYKWVVVVLMALHLATLLVLVYFFRFDVAQVMQAIFGR